ncbi:elongation factor P hydroxylase [Alkalilimnicola ehrlichii]|uniref:elongation factor P hydroxylase n=1 Tax=Alkalilimnicola ehrlichii TaxID=351052 RepID=UPI000E2F2364|nr:elongation factor P hydroxylase [Alkalilimnicola ehrlichii]RFA27026.1 elongation factor P hydroxylase [Alkalilimnicola ehrlichii]
MTDTNGQHDIDDLIKLFDDTFRVRENTVLVRGEDEPIYLPADAQHPQHRIIFAHGFYASALHEIAHWCIAGRQRRQLVDYGYWYHPDGRDEAEQAAFEKVEAKPQAVEWALSIAAGFTFNVSVDNLSGVPVDRQAFRRRVYDELCRYYARGFPPRAELFMQRLSAYYGTTFQLPQAA